MNYALILQPIAGADERAATGVGWVFPVVATTVCDVPQTAILLSRSELCTLAPGRSVNDDASRVCDKHVMWTPSANEH